ncbi:MAG: glycosyltransferase, partial [Actinomycetota bacterium]|nr:glycosyltransferase [Actinomycetota bacterium]
FAPSPSASLRVVCGGRIHPKKGHTVLIEAARLAAAEGSRWELDLWGDHLPEHEGLRRDLLRQVDEAGLSDRVDWRGFTVDTAAMYAGGDVAVVPSVVPEEFSLVCVEAQAMELAVVATGPGGASEVIVDGETGVIVPPGDAPALAAALRSLEVDPERRRRMGHRGRERMIRHFTREAYASAVRSHCLALAERPTVGVRR